MHSFNEFSSFCLKGNCTRNTIYNKKTCIRESKQERCYEKYKKVCDKKFNFDHDYNRFVVQVWNETFEEGYTGFSTRDNWENYCQLWAILSNEDREYIKTHFKNDVWLNKNLDVCHIREKGNRPDLKYDPDNAVIMGRYFHGLLDTFRHPVTRKSITKEERHDWLMRAKCQISLMKENSDESTDGN